MARIPLAKKIARPPLAAAPALRAPGKPPQGPRVPRQRQGNPAAQAPPKPAPTRVPKVRPIGAVPNPKKPKLVRDVDGGDLKDMFAVFPDLPRPHRPTPRGPQRTASRRRR